MEENKKSNKGLIITIVCLIVLLLVLIGYVVSEKVLFNRLDAKNNTTTTTKETEKISDDISYPKENDEDVKMDINLESIVETRIKEKNNENIKYTDSDIYLDINCSDFDEESNTCFYYNIKINDSIEVKDIYATAHLIANNKFIIIQDSYTFATRGNGIIGIYDYYGNELHEVHDTIFEYQLPSEDFVQQKTVKIKDNKLYYLKPSKDKLDVVEFRYIDLDNNFDDVLIQKFYARTTQQR